MSISNLSNTNWLFRKVHSKCAINPGHLPFYIRVNHCIEFCLNAKKCVWANNCDNSRVLLLCQIWIVNYYVKYLSDNLSNENKNTGVSGEVILQK